MSVEISNLAVRNDREIQDHIESIAEYHFKDGDTVRFHPEGRVELLFQFGSRFWHRMNGDHNWVSRARGFVGGLHDQSYFVKSVDGPAKCVGIKFRPGSAKYFIQSPQGALKNKVTSIQQIWGASARELLQCVFNSSRPEDLPSKIQPFLKSHFRQPSAAEEVFQKNVIRADAPIRRITEMAAESGLSTSHFRKKFQDMVGLSPKQFSKIVGINLAIARLRAGDFPSLTRLSLELGYYDQAHFIRTFKSITGVSPRQWLLENQ